MSAFISEVIGTMLLILFGCGVVAGVLLKYSKSENSGWIVITLGWGLAVSIGIYAAGNYSGAHLNPAVTIGLAAVGEFPWEQVPLYILAQFTGAIIGAKLVWLHYLPHWAETEDRNLKLAVFCNAPAISKPWANLTTELIGTFALVFSIMMIGANHFTEGLNPLVIGGLIVAIGLSLGGPTGYAINPARDLGPRIAHYMMPISGKGDSNWSYAWIPVVGPILGGALGALLYKVIAKQEFYPLLWVVLPVSLFIMMMAAIQEIRANYKY